MKYYLCKFLPPRADFLATMTPTEGDLMKRHGAFLNDLLGQGLVVAHGPVDDPAGRTFFSTPEQQQAACDARAVRP